MFRSPPLFDSATISAGNADAEHYNNKELSGIDSANINNNGIGDGTGKELKTGLAQKLGAVTRIKNEINELLFEEGDDIDLLKLKFNEYLLRVERLQISCDDESSRAWLETHKPTIDEFRERIEAILHPPIELKAPSVISKRSSRCSVSDAKVRLAEQKAKSSARRLAFEKSCNLQQQELEVKRLQSEQKLKCEEELLRLKLRKEVLNQETEENEIKLLEDELKKIEDNFDISIDGDNDENYATQNTKIKVPTDLSKILEKQNEISSSLLRNQRALSLPNKQLEPFDGSDITKFKGFMLKFERIIESRCINDEDTFLYLEQYTTGRAKRLVQSCSHNDASLALLKAKALLHEEYGNEYKVTNRYIEKLSNWPLIKHDDKEGLNEFSLFLVECNNYFEYMPRKNELNSYKEIMNLIMKLPYRLRENWRRKTYDLTKLNETITFETLVQFVREENNILRQPLFGDIVDKSKPEKKNTKVKSLLTSFDKKSKNEQELSTKTIKYCYCCKKNNHELNKCKFFENKTANEKSTFVKTLDLCFACLKKNHTSKQCQNKLICNVCGGVHPTVMHFSNKSRAPSQSEKQTEKEESSSIALTMTKNKKILYPVLPAIVKFQHSEEEILTNIVLDSCSSGCWIREDFVPPSVSAREQKIKVSTMNDKCKMTVSKIIFHIEIQDIHKNYKCVIPTAYTQVNTLWPFSHNDLPSNEYVDEYTHLDEVPFEFSGKPISILIGMDIPELHRPLSVVAGNSNEPFAVQYILGWSLCGPVDEETRSKLCNRIKVEDLDTKIENYFAQDFIEKSLGQKWSKQDEKWSEIVENSTCKRDEHYEIKLPFDDDDVSFPNNYLQVKSRFDGMAKRFKRDPIYLKEYKEFMDTMIKNEFMEEVPFEENAAKPGKVWYLTHHGVYHKQKKKIRVVFNCSLKYNGVSLNDKLLQGPDLTNSLLGVILRFRENSCAFIGDIEKMYYQVKVPPIQRNFMKLLWFDEEHNIKEYRLTVHVFGAKSSPSVANYALQRCASEHKEYSVEARSSVLKNFYVDDFLKSTHDDTEAVRVIIEVTKLLKEASFNLTSFTSNSTKVIQSLPKQKLGKELQHTILTSNADLPDSSALGILWHPRTDEFGFSVKVRPCCTNDLTKRNILSYLASLYDPTGICCPILIPAKQVFQECCRQKIGWDEQLPTNLKHQWLKWIDDLKYLPIYKMSRSLDASQNTSHEIHYFCDGSNIAYGAVCYLRSLNGTQITTKLLMAKARLTPISKSALTTTPRVELCSAKLAVEVALIIRQQLSIRISREYFWTDSSTVLCYIKSNTTRFHRFVTNKVAFISNYTDCNQWYYVPSKLNPADIISRGTTVEILTASSLWNDGPAYLRTNDAPQQISEYALPENDPEIKTNVNNVEESQECTAFEKILNSTNNFYQLKLRIATFLRLSKLLRKESFSRGKITLKEIRDAELVIIKFIQKKYFKETFICLISNSALKRNDKLRSLTPFIDICGILRVTGRLEGLNISYDVKHPIILPGESIVVKSMISEVHSLLGHLGRETILTSLRKKFWIIGANKVIKKLLRDCLICRKLNSKPTVQIMGDLPTERITPNLPVFYNVGIDCFGPFEVVFGRRTEKRYGLIFICLASKAVHLEVLNSLSSDSFINGVRRMMSRRGNINSITCDNGRNFVGASRELKQSIEDWNSKTSEWLHQRSIEFKFNPPFSSNFGGIWERQIRTIRKILNSMLAEQRIKMNDELFVTFMCEIESILNCRPITEVYQDINADIPLTPNNLLLYNAEVLLPPGLFNNDDSYYRKRWKQTQYLVDVFWKRWKKEYMHMLQERQKWQDKKTSINVGDLVLITDFQLPRNLWPLGIVVEAYKDKNSNVRIVKVKISRCKNGIISNVSTTIIERSISKIILLKSVGTY